MLEFVSTIREALIGEREAGARESQVPDASQKQCIWEGRWPDYRPPMMSSLRGLNGGLAVSFLGNQLKGAADRATAYA